VLLDTALAELEPLSESRGVDMLRAIYRDERELAARGMDPREASELDTLRRQVIKVKRAKLAALRRSGSIDDDVFHVLEEELDWAELGASPPRQFEIVEG
jgi:CPA1 family monovalent cation:H+ antiporter